MDISLHKCPLVVAFLIALSWLPSSAEAEGTFESLEALVTGGKAKVNRQNDLVRALSIVLPQVRSYFPNMKVVTTSETYSQSFSSVLLGPSEKADSTFATRALAKAVDYRLSNEAPPVTECQAASSENQCCEESPYASCVERYSREGELGRIGFFGSLFDLFAIEIAKSSFSLSTQQVAEGMIPPDTILFVWSRRPTKSGGDFLFTKIDEKILDRIITTLRRTGPLLGSYVGEENFALGYNCSETGWLPSGGGTQNSRRTLSISTGNDAGIRGIDEANFTTLEIASLSSGSRWKLRDKRSDAIGPPNKNMPEFMLAEQSDGLPSFGCLSSPAQKALQEQWNLLNSKRTAVVFFFGIYLSAVWSQLMTADMN